MTLNDAPRQATTAVDGAAPRRRICVYCGASGGDNPKHLEMARALGKAMADNDIDLGTLHPSHPSPCLFLAVSTNPALPQSTAAAPSA